MSAATCSSWLLAGVFFYPEDCGDTFLRNVGSQKFTQRQIPEDGLLLVYLSFVRIFFTIQCIISHASQTQVIAYYHET
jgi:hypothetical protein